MTPLARAHVDAVCLFGQGARCCAYLAMGEGFRCLKDDSGLAQIIKARIERGESRARGDNCSGPPEFESTTRSP